MKLMGLIQLICIVSIVVGMQGQSLDPKFRVASDEDGACELNNRHVDSLVKSLQEGNERVFIISRRNVKERALVDSARISSAVSVLKVSKQVNTNRIVTGVGIPTSSNGRLEFYLGSELFLVSYAKRNKQICLTCCT